MVFGVSKTDTATDFVTNAFVTYAIEEGLNACCFICGNEQCFTSWIFYR